MLIHRPLVSLSYRTPCRVVAPLCLLRVCRMSPACCLKARPISHLTKYKSPLVASNPSSNAHHRDVSITHATHARDVTHATHRAQNDPKWTQTGAGAGATGCRSPQRASRAPPIGFEALRTRARSPEHGVGCFGPFRARSALFRARSK